MKIKRYETVEKRYWMITEIADELGVATSAIRYWETVFHQVKPKRRYITAERKGWRKYTKKERNLVHRIHELLHVKKYTIEGAKQIING